MYHLCLFKEFYKGYEKVFMLPKRDTVTIFEKQEIKITHRRYTWFDEEYSILMMDVSKQLEPALYEADTILFDEIEEFTEVIFPMEGDHQVGFSLNKNQYFVLKNNGSRNRTVIGAYAVTFNKRSLFIYKTMAEQLKGYFIRRKNWVKIMINEEYKNIIPEFKMNVKSNFEDYVKNIVLKCKLRKLESLKVRNDIQSVMVVQDMKQATFEKNLLKAHKTIKGEMTNSGFEKSGVPGVTAKED